MVKASANASANANRNPNPNAVCLSEPLCFVHTVQTLFLGINLAFMFVELVVGFYSNSLSLMGDAGHMFFDCAALVIGLLATYIGRWEGNAKFTCVCFVLGAAVLEHLSICAFAHLSICHLSIGAFEHVAFEHRAFEHLAFHQLRI